VCNALQKGAEARITQHRAKTLRALWRRFFQRHAQRHLLWKTMQAAGMEAGKPGEGSGIKQEKQPAATTEI
jgi:DNA-binding SARP family transcriptional activator